MDIGNVQDVRRNLRNVYFIRQRKIYKILNFEKNIDFRNRMLKNRKRNSLQSRKTNFAELTILLTTLRYFVIEDKYLIIDYIYSSDDNEDLHGDSQPTVSRCLSLVCRALASIKNDYINDNKFPLTNEELATKKTDFRRKFNMPSIIGAIDCTHIQIKQVAGDYAQFKPYNMYCIKILKFMKYQVEVLLKLYLILINNNNFVIYCIFACNYSSERKCTRFKDLERKSYQGTI
ncbi:hypothetical protein AGLY_009069 [Aphis glycines]|uniref:DDE Tnp4 domain-containing protein n=1 Tax=Aphis glycines TaxID=307491 RepID=A0A6G0TIV0_APHGL|nr:hypothetical protein AGLY_009069 [Aphis glycines]